MIEFKGRVSAKCRKHIQKQEGKNYLFGITLALIVVIIPIVNILIYCSILPWQYAVAIVAPASLLIILISYFSAFEKKTSELIIPTRIVIADDGTIASHGEKFHLIAAVDEVTMVVDMGEWYHISFGKRLGLGRFVCQKDLLVQGTIEDFEKLFDGKIIRK